MLPELISVLRKYPILIRNFIRLPYQSLNSFLTLNGAGTVDSPGPLSGLDFEDGVMGTGKK